MKTERQIRFLMLLLFSVFLGLCLSLLTGCRTYNIYQFGTMDNSIEVMAEVEKQITPTVKASL